MGGDVQYVLRTIGDQLHALAARALPPIPTDYLPAVAEMSDRGGVKVFHPTYTVPDPSGKMRRNGKPATILKKAQTFSWRFTYEGKEHRGHGCASHDEAMAAGEDAKANVRAGHEQDWRKVTVRRLRELGEASGVGWDGSSKVSFRMAWNRLLRHLPLDMRVREITDTKLSQYVMARRAEGGADNTILLDLTYLRQAMKIANDKKLVPYVPKFPKLKRTRRENTLKPGDLDRIVANMPSQYRLYFLAAEQMGWRVRSELRTRTWDHIEWGPAVWECHGKECRGKRLTVDECSRCHAGREGWVILDAKSSKTDRGRRSPMGLRLREILMEARERWERVRRATGNLAVQWVFVTDKGGQMPRHTRLWQKALRKAGIGKIDGRTGPWSNGVVSHDIRRTTIRRWIRERMPREVRKALVGHRSDAAHKVYEDQELDQDVLLEATRQLDRDRARANVMEFKARKRR